MMELEDQLQGQRLQPGDRIRFRCHADLPCFNRCCRNKRLPLFPYDMLRLRRGLGLSSPDVLARHAELELDPGSGWPMLRIKLAPDGRCPFVSPQGCVVYAHRPACCRVYPLARAVTLEHGGQVRDLLLAQDTPDCLGWQQERELSVADYLVEQELARYSQANNRIARLFMHPRRPPMLALDERQTHAVVLALYNLDVLRQALATPELARPLGLTGPAPSSDERLLDMGQDWLCEWLFGAVDNVGSTS